MLLTTILQEWMIAWSTKKYLKEHLLRFSCYFTFFFSLFSLWLSLFKLSCTKKHYVCNLWRISYTLSFCYGIHYLVWDICVGGRLEDCFYCCSQQIISAVAIDFLIPYKTYKTLKRRTSKYINKTDQLETTQDVAIGAFMRLAAAFRHTEGVLSGT